MASKGIIDPLKTDTVTIGAHHKFQLSVGSAAQQHRRPRQKLVKVVGIKVLMASRF